MDTDRIIGGARELGGKAQKAAGRIVGDEDSVLQGAADQAAGIAQNAYGQAKDAVRDAVDAAPELVSRAGDIGRDYYRQGNRAVSERVGEQQIAALLIAGAVGFALGYLVSRRD